jgi:hypothetical protein
MDHHAGGRRARAVRAELPPSAFEEATMRRILTTVLTATTAATALAACGDDAPSRQADRRLQPVRVVASEYAYAMPSRIRGGLVQMEFVNDGKEVHDYSLSYVAAPHTAKEFVDLLLDPRPESQHEPPAWAQDVGGVPALSPGERVTITRRLKPGNYLLLCGAPTPDGKHHYDVGMHRQFTVSGTNDAAPPRADAVIVAQDKRFAVPALKAGPTTIELRNGASKERGFELFRMKPGKTMKDLEASFARHLRGPDPVVFSGAMQSIAPGASVFLDINLKGGATYLISDDDSGTRSRFTVAR